MGGKTDKESSWHLETKTKLFSPAESLGGVELLIEVPGQMTHALVADSPLAIEGSDQ